MPNSNGTPLGGIPRGGCWPEAGASVTLASAIHVVMEVTMSRLTKKLACTDLIAEPDSEDSIIAGQTGALKGTKSGESIVVGAVDVSVGLWTRVAGQAKRMRRAVVS